MKVRRAAFKGTVVGLDLSLTGAAACALPCPWDGALGKVRMMPMAGYPLKNDATATEQRERIIEIRNSISEFCQLVNAKHIVVEAYAFSASGKITMLAELCGVVKISLWEALHVSVESVHASSARKTLLQKLPKKDSKLFTKVNVQRLGGVARTQWTGDQIDAFVCANHALSTVGTALSYPGTW